MLKEELQALVSQHQETEKRQQEEHEAQAEEILQANLPRIIDALKGVAREGGSFAHLVADSSSAVAGIPISTVAVQEAHHRLIRRVFCEWAGTRGLEWEHHNAYVEVSW